MSTGQIVFDVGSWRLGEDGSIYRRGKLKYSNGDYYEGEWMNGKRNGRGILVFLNGDKYIGEFQNDFYHGYGVFSTASRQHPFTKKWIKGDKYEGTFLNGKKHGKGLFVTEDGDSYNGELDGGYFHGQGIYSYVNGDIYEGQWKRGKWQGKGELRMKDGSKYIGDFLNGKYHGFGKLQYGGGGKNGSYVGDFSYGRKHGKGVRVFLDGSRYEGEWKNDEMWGVGVLEKPSKVSKGEEKSFTKYVGEFIKGLYEGHGAISYANGDYYEGNFLCGHLHGEGIYQYADGGFYKGEYHSTRSAKPLGMDPVIAKLLKHEKFVPNPNSKRHGKGLRVWSNGNSYEGEWKDNEMHGFGILKQTISTPHGDGQLEYEGDFLNGYQNGNAIIRYQHFLNVERLLYRRGPRHTNNKSSDTTKQKEETPEDHDSNSIKEEEDEEMEGEEYEFPLHSGLWHQGRGKSIYEGQLLKGQFHGQGTLTSPDGQLWKGHWKNGKLHGKGERVFLPKILYKMEIQKEMARLSKKSASSSIQPKALYSIVHYVGDFMENIRHGKGRILFANGDTLEGNFYQGLAQGSMKYTFGQSQRQRYCIYQGGTRMRWLSFEEEEKERQKEEEEAKILQRSTNVEEIRNALVQALIKHEL